MVCGDLSGLKNSFTLLSVTVGTWTYGPLQHYDSGNFVFICNRVDLEGGLCSPAEVAMCGLL